MRKCEDNEKMISEDEMRRWDEKIWRREDRNILDIKINKDDADIEKSKKYSYYNFEYKILIF